MKKKQELNYGSIIKDRSRDIFLIRSLYKKTLIHKHPYVVLLRLTKKWTAFGYGVKIRTEKIKMTREDFEKEDFEVIHTLYTD